MNQIDVIIATDTECVGDVDALSLCVPQLTEEWQCLLEEACSRRQSLLELPAMHLSATNSKNFQVVGMLYKVIRAFQKEHSFPECVQIHCPDEVSATMYKQIYNFYVPRTKDERLNNGCWD